MAVNDDKMAPTAGAIRSMLSAGFEGTNNLTGVILRAVQIPFSFLVVSVQLYGRAVTNTVTATVGIVRPGRAIQAVTLVIGTTVAKFKLNAALTAVMPHRGRGLPAIVNKAIQDNIPFTSAFTINVAAAAGQFWGAVRVQMDASGTITTKVAAQDQAYISEGAALYHVPAPDPGFFDLGTITIEAAIGAAFTAQTTALNAAGTTVHYNGTAAGFVNVCDTDPVFVQGNIVEGDMVDTEDDRGVSQIGGLIVVKETTDGAGTGTSMNAHVGYRVWPVNSEIAPAVQE